MKIGVNARLLTKPFTGIGQYTFNLFRELAVLDGENEYILVVPEKVSSKGFSKNVRMEVLKEKKFPSAGMRKTWWEQISLPEFFEKEKVDTAFFPYPSNPWTKDWYKKGIKTVVTVHDCIPWKCGEYRRGLLSKMYHAQTRKAVKRADLVLTVSEASKKDVEKICGAKKVEVVYNDAGDDYKVDEYDDDVLGDFNLKKGQFFVYCGGFDKRKNVSFLVDEFLSGDFDIPLVLVGGKLFKDKLYSSFDELADERVIKTGFLETENVAALYHSCAAFVHFSKDEGFNIPLLEAANCGAPLVLSDIAVHREVAGDSALFVDLKKGAGLAAMKKILKDREEFSKKSKSLAEKYSWKKSAEKVLDLCFDFGVV